MSEKQYKYVTKYHTFIMSDGTPKQMKFRGKTEKEAELKMQEAIFKYQHGLLVFTKDTPFAQYAEKWADGKTKDAVRRMSQPKIAIVLVFYFCLSACCLSCSIPCYTKSTMIYQSPQTQKDASFRGNYYSL